MIRGIVPERLPGDLWGASGGLQFALEHIGAERILFGTDLPIGGAASAKWNMAKIRSAIADEAARRAIFGENARRLA